MLTGFFELYYILRRISNPYFADASKIETFPFWKPEKPGREKRNFLLLKNATQYLVAAY